MITERNNHKKSRIRLQSSKMIIKNEDDKIHKTNFTFSQSQKLKIDKFKDINNIYKKSKSKNILNTSKIFLKNKNKHIINSKDNIDYDDLPFTMALILEKRNIFCVFRKKLTEKIKIIDIFVNREIKQIILSEHILYLLIDLTMNALLYSDNIVSHKSHNNGQLDFIIVFFLTIFSNIFASIIGYYLERLIDIEERIYKIKDIKIEKEFLRVLNIILREVSVRVIIFFILEICIILFCEYYLFIFFTIYHKSQMSLLKNYVISLLEGLLVNITITILIVTFRTLGIYYKNKYIYNTSK